MVCPRRGSTGSHTRIGGRRSEEATVLCLHGLTRQGRDFDFLAATLARHGRRVVCPDLPGRGRSDRLPSAFHYVFPQHCADAAVMVAATTSVQVDWVGTSIGGLIGIVLAGLPRSPIRRLVINDIGPSVSAAAVFRICEKLTRMPQLFETFDSALDYFRAGFSTYGSLEDHHWVHIVQHSVEWVERVLPLSASSWIEISRMHLTCFITTVCRFGIFGITSKFQF